ncbi:MAG: ribosomal subunit interface protein [Phycisphaera sp.]|nr:MAG: ribosomal subunit interface protein [Phycisphaera sp.]
MRIDVVGLKFELTDAIREYAESKSEKLTRYFDRTQMITIRLSERTKRAGEFDVEIVTDVEKHENFVSTASGDDLYLTIDSAVNKMSRQLTDFKEKLKLSSHHPDAPR